MSRYLSEKLKTFVSERAENTCEYCLVSIDDTYLCGEIDHIISLKHGGETDEKNLALACQPCNRNKGSDLGSIPAKSGRLKRFYNPRIDLWSKHFQISNGRIEALTVIGQVTVNIFDFNSHERISERGGLIEIGRYPPEAMRKILYKN